MRKPRDYDAELKALDAKARELRERKVKQLGELVIACGADVLPIEQLAGMLLVGDDERIPGTKEAWQARGAAFFQAKRRSANRTAGDATGSQTNDAARNRIAASQARSGERPWLVKRRERTRQLIELGGLVVKAGLIELTDDDRATLYGAFLDVAARLRGDDREQQLLLWRRRGRRAFDADAAATGRPD